MLESGATINGQALRRRDGFGLWEPDELITRADSLAELLPKVLVEF